MGLLSKQWIDKYREEGEIVISPFDSRNLKSTQYDVTLGEHCYREIRSDMTIYNPFDEEHTRRKWQLDRAIRHGDLVDDGRIPLLKNVGLDEKLILIKPGEMILGHTEEFIGGASNRITTMMKARSSVGRNGLEICRCAGMGDVGYFQRWTMEIVNTSGYTIPFPAGRRVAQILFFEVAPVAPEDMYALSGKYQTSTSLEDLKASWKPEQMLPKQWRDRECEPHRGAL